MEINREKGLHLVKSNCSVFPGFIENCQLTIGPGGLGIFRTIYFEPDKDGIFHAGGGDTYVAVVEFSDPVKAMAVMAYGNASQPHSSHRYDQIELAVKKKLHPVWRTKLEIEKHLEKREIFE